MPAPKKLEDPIEPLSGGAVPMVPVTPPPRASRAGARTPRPYAQRSGQHSPGYSAASRYGSSYASAPAEDHEPTPKPAEAHRQAEPPAPADDAAESPADVTTSIDLSAETTGHLHAAAGAAPDKAANPDSGSETPESAQAPSTTYAPGRPSGLRRLRRAVRRAARSASRRFSALDPNRVPTVIVTILVVAVAVGALAYVSTSWFSPFMSSSEETTESTDEAATTTEEEEEEEEEVEEETGPEVRDTLADYSWEELSEISALIAEASSDEEGLEIAISYNLCQADGTIDPDNTKDVELSDGTVVPVAVAGFRHDTKSDGAGVAGISFIARDSAGKQPMDSTGAVISWEEMPLRTWLNETLLGELPDELANLVVAVDKTTNLPADVGSGQVTTSETLWILSYSELVGELDPSTQRYDSYVSEGEQYQIFADAGVTSTTEGNEVLVLSDAGHWWLRTPDTLTNYRYLLVMPVGDTGYGHRTSVPDDVVFGFCL